MGLGPTFQTATSSSLTQPATRASTLPSSPGDSGAHPALVPRFHHSCHHREHRSVWELKSCGLHYWSHSQSPRAPWDLAVSMPHSLPCSPSAYPGPLARGQCGPGRSSSQSSAETSSSSGRYSFRRVYSSHEEPSESKSREERKWVRFVRPKSRPLARGRAANLGKKSRLLIHLPNLLGRGRFRLPPPDLCPARLGPHQDSLGKSPGAGMAQGRT